MFGIRLHKGGGRKEVNEVDVCVYGPGRWGEGRGKNMIMLLGWCSVFMEGL